MMLHTIEDRLKGLGLADWRITEIRRRGSEAYYLGKRLDLSRAIDACDYKVTVYVDSEEEGKPLRGEATVSVHPTMDAAELDALLGRATFAASRVKNPRFELPGPASALLDLPRSGFSARPSEEWMEELAAALYRADGSGGARINSLELFLSEREIRIKNSRGLDVSWKAFRGYAEYVVEAASSAAASQGGVELLDDLSFSEPDFERLSEELAARLELVKDRALARPLPALEGLPLLVVGREAEELFDYFFQNAQSRRIYSKSSPFALGEPVLGASALERLELRAEAALPGNPASAPFDAEGRPLAPRPLIVGGKLSEFSGPTRYAAYLGREPRGDFPLFSVGPGSTSPAELRERPHLETALFSDFQLDPDSGDFGGELRLAYWFDGNKRIPVTGGSATGCLTENFPCLRISSELRRGERSSSPEAILLPRVSITGAG